MEIVAIDAGRGYSTVSRSVRAAAQAAEKAGAHVRYIALDEYCILSCTGCKLCATGDGCKVQDDLPYLSNLIAQADGIILGTPSSGKSNTRHMNALLTRLRTYFQDPSQPQLPGMGLVEQSATARATRRAIIITTAQARTPIATLFSSKAAKTGSIRELRQALASSGISAFGTIEVPAELEHGRTKSESLSRATSLGRMLAGRL